MSSKTQQLSLFASGEDLPLFSGTPVNATLSAFQPQPTPAKQASFAACPVCLDTGRVGEKRCTCAAGRRQTPAKIRVILRLLAWNGFEADSSEFTLTSTYGVTWTRDTLRGHCVDHSPIFSALFGTVTADHHDSVDLLTGRETIRFQVSVDDLDELTRIFLS